MGRRHRRRGAPAGGGGGGRRAFGISVGKDGDLALALA